VYLYWTESPTGADSSNLADLGSIWFDTAPLRTNRVDRFVWDGSSLTWDLNLIRLRSYQADAGQQLRGNHNGGVIQFGLDGKLNIVIGDNGRRGQMQNLPTGPPPGSLAPYAPADDEFGGPEPDDNHLTGVILRLNDDGTAPADNPFFVIGVGIGGEAGANIQKIFAYGIRNSFGLVVDSRSGFLWNSQNGDDSFGEINRFDAGSNGGWTQIMGPVSRVAEFKAIETSQQFAGLQQIRWPPTLIADTPVEALARLFVLPGSSYVDPELSWRYEVSPTAIGFLDSGALGPQYDGDLFVGSANAPPAPNLAGGFLFRLELSGDRRSLAVAAQDPRLADRVADNNFKYDGTESESLLFGRDFGGVTDIKTGPNGNLFVVSVTRGTIYEIFPLSQGF
jgi:glucose/arabinose dehydrogenase